MLSCVVLLLSSVRSLRDLSKIVRMLDKSNIKLSNILNKDVALSYTCHTKTCCSCSVLNLGEKNSFLISCDKHIMSIAIVFS